MREDLDQSIDLIRLLADGRLHSGSELAAALGVSRAAVWKRIEKLAVLGVAVNRMRSQGYCTQEPLELLDAGAIGREASNLSDTAVGRIDVIPVLDSTNRLMLDRIRRRESEPWDVILAECQTAGRGRRGRKWVSPFGRNLYLSMHWRYSGGASGLAGLSLVVGLAVAELLRDYCGLDARLKWPNDVQIDGAKIAGVLIEIEGDLAGDLDVVVGAGLNISMPLDVDADVGQPWTDVATHAIASPSRNALAARLIAALARELTYFGAQGFPPFLQRWNALDALAGHDVEISGGVPRLKGIAAGVDSSGCLLLESSGRTEAIASGEVSLRKLS